MAAIPKIVSPVAVQQLLKTVRNLRMVDCTYNVGPKPDHRRFREEHYGKFEELRQRQTAQKAAFLQEHIPQAVHFDLDVGMFPGRYERFSVYEPAVFERYARLLGLNNEDHLVFYGRGPFGGMLFAARCFWLFKGYGHQKLSLLDGGLANWKAHGLEIESTDGGEYPPVPEGNFSARDQLDEFYVKFEELNREGGFFDHPEHANLIDSRIRAQFDGRQDTGLDPNLVNATRIRGTTNVPAAEFLNAEGTLRPLEEIQKDLFHEYKADKPTVTYCNTGMQAALAAVVHDAIFPNAPARLYNGSLKELEQRAPKRINDGPTHLS
ncbi:putative thiosulfate sulfurtransferase mpst-1 [Aphelenchoides fujianensis]|nr:putative thiosulfate sulfurtransferase mpst-1 [Aphelenchoides fujianensis]